MCRLGMISGTTPQSKVDWEVDALFRIQWYSGRRLREGGGDNDWAAAFLILVGWRAGRGT
jgi:hypothetical protein